MIRIFISQLILLCLTACTQNGNSSLPSHAASAAPPAAPPAVTTYASAEELWKLRGEVMMLELKVSTLETGAATVSTEEEGFDVARTRFGPLTVSSRGVTPYLDGYKVKIRIGNLTNANFTNAKLKLGWGPTFDTSKDPEAWQKAQKTREMGLTTKLMSGSFTDVDVVLTPAKPEEIKSFTVHFDLNQLELRVR